MLPAKGTLKSAAFRSPWPTEGAVSSRQHARPAASGPPRALPFLLICKASPDPSTPPFEARPTPMRLVPAVRLGRGWAKQAP